LWSVSIDQSLMLRILLTIGVFMLSVHSHAQYSPSTPAYEQTANRSANNLSRSSSEGKNIALQHEKETAIRQLVTQYPTATPDQQAQLRQQISMTLHHLLDLKISATEAEVAELDRALHNMQSNDRYSEKQVEIHNLQEALISVKQNLQYRKKHKSEIVKKRMQELLSAYR